MSLPAGAEPPAPDELEEVAGPVHAVDGDGAAVCAAATTVEPVDSVLWSEVPPGRRCTLCEALLGR